MLMQRPTKRLAAAVTTGAVLHRDGVLQYVFSAHAHVQGGAAAQLAGRSQSAAEALNCCAASMHVPVGDPGEEEAAWGARNCTICLDS